MYERGKGNGTKLLRAFLGCIDRVKVILTCVPNPYVLTDGKALTGVVPENGLDRQSLNDWYCRHGFMVSKYKSDKGNAVYIYHPPVVERHPYATEK